MRGIYNILLAFKNRVIAGFNGIFNVNETTVTFTAGEDNTFNLTNNTQEF